MKIDNMVEELHSNYKLNDNPKEKTKQLRNVFATELYNELEKREEVYGYEGIQKIDSITDYDVELRGMGDGLYKIRLNLVWQMYSMIRTTKDLKLAVKLIINHIHMSNLGFKGRAKDLH
jgi:hypothetical protein